MNFFGQNMNSDLNPLHNQLFRPIPSMFHSFELDGPFTHCTACQKDLKASKASYLLEKIISRGEVIAEYALCRECMQPMREEISEESKTRIQAFYKENRKVWQDLTKCNLCLQPMEELVSYKIVADCIGDTLFSLNHPTTLCGTCHGKLSECVSELTRKNMEGYRDKLFPDPPQVAKELKEESFATLE